MREFIDMKGRRCGRWTVLCQVPSTLGLTARWRCQCECGNISDVNGPALRLGRSLSCGCLHKEIVGRNGSVHGAYGTATYKIWGSMIQRCTNKKSRSYSSYGGRGITVCDRWLKFENFFADMGEKPPGLSIERINNDGNYELRNCKWATTAEQSNNKRSTRRLPYKGQMVPLQVVAKEVGLSVHTIRKRLFLGWSEEEAITK